MTDEETRAQLAAVHALIKDLEAADEEAKAERLALRRLGERIVAKED